MINLIFVLCFCFTYLFLCIKPIPSAWDIEILILLCEMKCSLVLELKIKSIMIFKINGCSQTPVAHTYNPSYSGGRDQEDCDLKPAPGI
jgi:hypothetical protein